jgi:hypothetical protein
MSTWSRPWVKWILVPISLCVLVLVAMFALVQTTMVTRVMTRPSPDGRHSASLYRIDGIDVNFWINLDYRRVYGSPDFGGYRKDHRERIMWTEDSKWLVFEVADRRLFGYDVSTGKSLSPDELASARFIPFEKLHYEGD